jgi:hypothetical protein
MAERGIESPDRHVGYGVNEYGTRVSLHVCLVCGREFTVCGAQDGPIGGCLFPECDSYDIERDAEIYFLPSDPDLIERER